MTTIGNKQRKRETEEGSGDVIRRISKYQAGYTALCRKISFSNEAASLLHQNVTAGTVRPLAVYVDYLNREGVIVLSEVPKGYNAYMVLVNRNGENFLSKDVPVRSIIDSAEVNAKLNWNGAEKLADASVLLDSDFIRQLRNQVLIISSGGASSLIGREEVEPNEHYRIGAYDRFARKTRKRIQNDSKHRMSPCQFPFCHRL